MPKCHDVRQFAPIQPRIDREPFRTSEEAIDVSPDNLFEASFSKSAPPIRPRRRLLNLSFDEGDRLLHPTRAMAATGPIHRGEGSFTLFKGLSRRILDFAALRKLTARMVSYRALSPSRTPSAINPLEFACAHRVRNGRSAIVFLSNSGKLLFDWPFLAQTGRS
jgi:hypothetical protein